MGVTKKLRVVSADPDLVAPNSLEFAADDRLVVGYLVVGTLWVELIWLPDGTL